MRTGSHNLSGVNKFLEIGLYIALPLAYGVFVEFLFELVRAARRRKMGSPQPPPGEGGA